MQGPQHNAAAQPQYQTLVEMMIYGRSAKNINLDIVLTRRRRIPQSKAAPEVSGMKV